MTFDFDAPITRATKLDTSVPINFANDDQDGRHVVIVTPDDRIQSRQELDEKYGPGNWVIKYEGFENPSSITSLGINPENPRRRVW